MSWKACDRGSAIGYDRHSKFLAFLNYLISEHLFRWVGRCFELEMFLLKQMKIKKQLYILAFYHHYGIRLGRNLPKFPSLIRIPTCHLSWASYYRPRHAQMAFIALPSRAAELPLTRPVRSAYPIPTERDMSYLETRKTDSTFCVRSHWFMSQSPQRLYQCGPNSLGV